MLENITYAPILGLPLMLYLGIITLVLMLATVAISLMNRKQPSTRIPFNWHPRMAVVTVIVALIHGILGMLLYF